MQGVQILVINAYNSSNAKSQEQYNTFMKMLISLFGKESLIIEKRFNELSDYVFDWEHSLLDESTKSTAKRFDKVDMIFLSGDGKLMPWDVAMRDLTLLLHMCNFVQKPVVCTGTGPFQSIYALCCNGTRFDIINGPNGNALERLPSYGKCAAGTKTNPSGWLDSETGDVYKFDRKCKSWIPVCCVGSYRLPKHGRPSTGTVYAPSRKYARDDRRLNEQSDVEAFGDKEDVVVVRNSALQHYLLHKLPFPKFVLTLPDEWHLNGSGGLPTHENLFILADGTNGPVLLTFDNCLLIAAEITHGNAYNYIRQILKNFIRQILRRLQGENRDAAGAARFMDRLFGTGGHGNVDVNDDVAYPTVKMAPTHASSIVPSSLALGPKNVATAGTVDRESAGERDVFTQAGAGDRIDYTALLSPRTHTTLGKKVHVAQKKDARVRSKRLDVFLAAQGHAEMQPLNKKAALLAQKQKDKRAKNIASDNHGCDSSVRDMLGDEYLRKPVPREKEVIVDNRQPRPPAIKFQRPESAQPFYGRWNGGKDNYCDTNAKAPIFDHLYGEYGMDTRRPASHSARRSDLNYFLPRMHPTRKTRIPEFVDRKGNKISPPTTNSKVAQAQCNHDTEDEIPAPSLVVVENPRQIPFSNHKKFERMAAEDLALSKMRAPYEGTYTEPFRTEDELALHEYNESKKKFLFGPFQTSFGVASQIPLRKSGVVGGDPGIQAPKVDQKNTDPWLV